MSRTWVRMDRDCVETAGWFSDYSCLSYSDLCGEGLLLIVWSFPFVCQKAFQ